MRTAYWIKILVIMGLAHKPLADVVLGLSGVGLAGASVAFAATMIAQSGQGPRINGAEHLGVFAQPVSVPYTGGDLRRSLIAQLDMMPVGSVRARRATPEVENRDEKIVAGYRMRGLSQGEALVQGPDGFLTLKPGSEIADIGRVLSFEARGRRLVIVTTGGLIVGDD